MLRKQRKHAARKQRARIFQLGSRGLFFLRLGQRCLEWIYCAYCLRLEYISGMLFYMVLSFLFHVFQVLRICLTEAVFAVSLYAHIFILCLLLLTPVLRAVLVTLQEYFRHCSLFVVAMSADPLRGCVLGLLWMCDLHFLTPRTCECWSRVAYVAATTTHITTASSVHLFAWRAAWTFR